MDKQKKEELKLKLKELEREFRKCKPIMRGSVTHMGSRNKQPYFSLSLKSKTKIIYLGDKRAKIAQQYVDNYKRAIELINQMTLIHMQILKDRD